MSDVTTAQENGGVLVTLERKRALDFVWVLTLALQASALLLSALSGGSDRSPASLSRGVLGCGVLFVIAADLSYRIKSPRAVDRSIYAVQLLGAGMLAYLWALSGGTANAAGLAFFVPPLIASGMVGMTWLPQLTAGLAIASVWIAAASGAPSAAGSGVLWLFTAAAVGIATAAPILSNMLVRLHQRIRCEATPAEETRGTLEALLRSANDPIAVVYADTLQLAHASDSFYQRMLIDRRASAGRSLFNLLRFANRERMESMLEEEHGVIPFQHVEIGPEPIVANLRFFHSEEAGSRYIHITFEEVTDLYYFQLAFDAIEDPLLIVGDGGDLFYANRAANALFGDLYVGKPMLALLQTHRLVPQSSLHAAKRIDRLQVGSALFRQNLLTPKVGARGQTFLLFWLQKFSEEEVRADRVRRDSLTGLLNRRAFERDLSQHAREASRSAPVAVALWSIDSFKESCDQRGEAAGDALLRAFAATLGDRIRPGDAFYHLDGDVFAVIYPGTDLAGAESAVQRLMIGLGEQTLELDGAALALSASVGVTVTRPREALPSLMARADEALHTARQGGGGCFVARSPDER